MIDLILRKIKLRTVEQPEGDVQNELVQKSKLEQGTVSSLSLQLSKTVQERVKRDRDGSGGRRVAGKEIGREVKKEPRMHNIRKAKGNCFKKEGMVKVSKVAKIKKNKHQEYMIQLNYLEVPDI